MPTYPSIDLGYHKTGTGWDNDPFTICFVYHPNGVFVVKGMSSDVDLYVLKHYPKSIQYMSYWKNGVSRGHFHSYLFFQVRPSDEYQNEYNKQRRQYLDGGPFPKVRNRYDVLIRRKGRWGKVLRNVRRVPRKWLKEYEEIDSALAV
jgi:hypothetical protein